MAGPYVSMATFCESAEIDAQRGLFSIKNAYSQLIVADSQPDDPTAMAEFNETLVLATALVADDARGQCTVSLVIEKPSGIRMPAIHRALTFDTAHQRWIGANPFQFKTNEPGLYWVDLLIEGQLLTRVPLQITHQPAAWTDPG